MASKLKPKKEQAVVAEAKENADSWFTYWSANNNNYTEQTKFWVNAKNQWDDDTRARMTGANKIPLTCPKVYGIARRIIGEQRQATPDMRVSSITSKASADDVTLNDDMVRTISFKSNAKIAYQTAYANSLFGGFSALEVCAYYEKPDTFEQEICIKPVFEPTNCFWDPNAREFAKQDGLFAGMYVGMSKKAFKKEYPDVDVSENEMLPRSQTALCTKDSVYILIYQRKEFKRKSIVQLENGEILEKKDYDTAFEAYREQFLAANPKHKSGKIPIPYEFQVKNKRITNDYKIHTYKIAGNTVLDHSVWKAKHFSYIYVDADSHYVDGKQVTRGFFEDAQDLQIFANYLFTQINHLIKAQRNEQWLISLNNIAEGYQDIWNNPDLTQSALVANPDGERGGAMPERLVPVPLSPTLVQQYEQIPNAISSTLGIYDAYQGKEGNEVSGVAIDNRIKQGNLSTFIIQSNLNRAIGQVGAVVLDAIPNIYDTARPMALKMRDGGTRNLVLNSVEDGVLRNEIKKGDYYIDIDAGASFEGQKQESLMALEKIMQGDASGTVYRLIADLFAENTNLPNTQVIVNRLRAGFVPPEIVAAGNGEEPPPPPPQEPTPEQKFMEADIAIREQKNELERQKNEWQIQMQQEKLDLDRQKAEVQADIANQKLLVDKAKLGL